MLLNVTYMSEINAPLANIILSHPKIGGKEDRTNGPLPEVHIQLIYVFAIGMLLFQQLFLGICGIRINFLLRSTAAFVSISVDIRKLTAHLIVYS